MLWADPYPGEGPGGGSEFEYRGQRSLPVDVRRRCCGHGGSWPVLGDRCASLAATLLAEHPRMAMELLSSVEASEDRSQVSPSSLALGESPDCQETRSRNAFWLLFLRAKGAYEGQHVLGGSVLCSC